ncbi:MAG: hypothetical protein AB7I37_25285 [Pirellulales bacterium]
MVTEITQNEDFASFKIDGHEFDVDLYAARDALAKIDVKYRDDLWECLDCHVTFTRSIDDLSADCPQCHQPNTRKDERWLDDVAAYVRTFGVARCGRNGAGKFYSAIIDAIDSIKKKSSPTLESHSGSEVSIAADGEAAESTPG